MKKFTLFVLCLMVSLLSWSQPAIKNTSLKELKKEKVQNKVNLDQMRKAFIKKEKKKLDVAKAKKNKVRINKSAQENPATILSEDFSKFTAGSEATPDATEMAPYIPESYTQTPGWYGEGVFQAGGCAYLAMIDDGEGGYETGFLDTPYLDLSSNSGNFIVKFRAKSKTSADTFLIIFGTEDDYDYEEFDITNNWQEFSFEAYGGDVETFVEFYASTSECYIDDIEVLQPEGLNAPTIGYPTNVTPTSFTANWESVSGATSYLLSVYSYESEDSAVEETTITEGFDLIKTSSDKMIDTTDPNYPEGWTIDVTTNGTSRHVYKTATNYSSAPQSLAFDNTGDYIITPLSPAPIKEFSLWLKGQSASGTTKIIIDAFDGSQWANLGEISVVDLGGEVVDISDYLTDNVLQVKISFSKNVGNCSIDDISYTYGGSVNKKIYLLENVEITTTSHNVSGLSEGVQYFYTVKAKNEDLISAESEEMLVKEYLLEIDAPVATPATNVSDEGFTANWNSVENADLYILYTTLEHSAPADGEYIIANETFDGITDDTEAIMWGYLDEYTNRPDWFVIMPLFEAGKVGLDNSLASLGLPGMLISPNYVMSTTADKFTVTIKASSTVGDIIYVTNTYGESESDYETETATFDAAERTFTFEFNTISPEYNNITIETSSSDVTYIDEIKISVLLKKGESVTQPYNYLETSATSANIATLDKQPGDVYSYVVQAAYIPDNEEEDTVLSDFSNEIIVPGGSSVNDATLNFKIFVDNNLHVILKDEATISLYSISGTFVSTEDGKQGENIISLPVNGVYIVKVGNKATKIIK